VQQTHLHRLLSKINSSSVLKDGKIEAIHGLPEQQETHLNKETELVGTAAGVTSTTPLKSAQCRYRRGAAAWSRLYCTSTAANLRSGPVNSKHYSACRISRFKVTWWKVFLIRLWPIDRVKVLRPTRHKLGHFGVVLPSQSLGLVMKTLNATQEKQHKNKIASVKTEKHTKCQT